MTNTKTIPPWTKRVCDHCSTEYYVTRTMERVDGVLTGADLLCEACGSYSLGYSEGSAEVVEAKNYVADALRKACKHRVCVYKPDLETEDLFKSLIATVANMRAKLDGVGDV